MIVYFKMNRYKHEDLIWLCLCDACSPIFNTPYLICFSLLSIYACIFSLQDLFLSIFHFFILSFSVLPFFFLLISQHCYLNASILMFWTERAIKEHRTIFLSKEHFSGTVLHKNQLLEKWLFKDSPALTISDLHKPLVVRSSIDTIDTFRYHWVSIRYLGIDTWYCHWNSDQKCPQKNLNWKQPGNRANVEET